MATTEEHAARSTETLRIVRDMEDGLGRAYNETQLHFHEDFTWRGNVGCGIKHGLQEFRKNWQLPIRAAFKDRVYKTEKFIADGDWAACFGILEATHHGRFMGIPATGKRVRIPYMDFWHVKDGRIKDNPVFVDFASVLLQLGRDVFDGEGWEAYDSGERPAPEPI
ncbi:ester cyclase [Mesorhizobium sp. INR15]|uniref:ester cyclase n=1 Tax=Mesorhizobium sp. INR15 TaxID=2654248 RepID=UPI00189647A4|nr:ester cyclase [Mesorhizobium sp. INR15]QPC95516.1 polyketide cyclase [Mesorhizobium sp. INR15]